MGRIGVTPQDKFRINHSTLIEHYQFIEFHLEGIYAQLCGKDFYEGMKEVEADNIRRLLKRINDIVNAKGISIFSAPDYKKLEYICARRNFWCHNCYVDMVFDSKTHAPRDTKALIDDLFEAEELRENLYELKMRILHNPISD